MNNTYVKWYVIFMDDKDPSDWGPFDTEILARAWAAQTGDRSYQVRQLDPLSDPNGYKGAY